MRTCILAFAFGVALLQQQAELPEIAWAWVLLPGAVSAFLLVPCRIAIFAVIGRVLLVAFFLGAGFFWAAIFAQWRMADVLPHEWEGRDIQLIGVVAELPQANEHSLRFAFDVEQVLTKDAVVPARISLAWYKERGKHADTFQSALPSINAGERWQITARLKRPHGTVNPHGFDFEEWAVERNIRATGYVRKADDNLRLNEMVDQPGYRVERLRQEIRERFIRALPEHAYTGVLVALAVGDQRFERCALIKFLGWCGRSKRGTPTGDQYAQLERALDYLRNGNIASSQVMRQLDEINGTRTIGGNFSILQSWTKSVPLGRQRPGNSVAVEATYSREFADLLRHESGLVSFSAAKFTSLTRGISRALFRHLEGLRACTKEPTVTVDANALLAHLGSRRRDLEPSRMHEILDDAHVELYAHRIIGAHPTWSTSPTGKRVITYLLEGAPDLPKLLKQSALDYGVTGSSAEQWARGRTEQLAQVLAAAVQGILTPTKDIGRMVRNYVENSRHIDPEALPHFEPGRGLLLPGQRCVEFEYLELQYKETNDWLHAHPTIESTLRRQYTSLDRPLWVVDGLVLLAARPLCRADTLQAWKARVDDAWVKGEACAEGAD